MEGGQRRYWVRCLVVRYDEFWREGRGFEIRIDRNQSQQSMCYTYGIE